MLGFIFSSSRHRKKMAEDGTNGVEDGTNVVEDGGKVVEGGAWEMSGIAVLISSLRCLSYGVLKTVPISAR